MTQDTIQTHEDGPTGEDRYIVPGLLRGLAILESFTKDHPERSLAVIAREAGLPRATAFRLLHTLETAGYVERNAARRTFRLGNRVLRLGYNTLSGRGLVDIATPVLERLRDATGCTTHLVVLAGTDVVYVVRCPGPGWTSNAVGVGTRLPAHATVIGRALLAHMPLADVVRLYDGYAFSTYTDATPGDLGALVAQLEVDRPQRSLASWGYFEPDVASIAAPIRNRVGIAEAAVNAICPLSAYDRAELEDVVRIRVEAAAAEISAALGYQP
ncbi:IclR family transcriptional regulator [Gluconacetobacter sacchari]|uniref:IclR family transcriptional regulator n=1 Tax=Gluconacetobacter sacchari TaxID=92759 RepID=UPI0039B61755